MAADTTSMILRRRLGLQMARDAEQYARMREYDQTVYYPELADLRRECRAAGHGPVTHERNGFGWAWTQCTYCGSRVDQWSELEEDEGGR